jgi:hypothetical protein
MPDFVLTQYPKFGSLNKLSDAMKLIWKVLSEGYIKQMPSGILLCIA